MPRPFSDRRIDLDVRPGGAAFPIRAERSTAAIGVFGDRGDDVGDFVGGEATAEVDRRQVMAVHAICKAAQQRLPQIRRDAVDDELIRGDANGKPGTVSKRPSARRARRSSAGSSAGCPGGIHRAPMQRDGHVHEELRQLTRRLRIPSGRAGRGDLRRGQRMRAGAKRDGEGLLGSHTSIRIIDARGTALHPPCPGLHKLS